MLVGYFLGVRGVILGGLGRRTCCAPSKIAAGHFSPLRNFTFCGGLRGVYHVR